MTKIKVLIVDDHYMVRIGLVNTIGANNDLMVVGEASDGAQAIEKFRQLRPDVVLMDFQMPDMNGVETAAKLRQEFPEASVILHSVYQRDEDIWRAVQAGVMGYLPKSVEPNELWFAISRVVSGKTYFPPSIMAKLDARSNRSDLSKREHEVLQLLVAGCSNKEIATKLDISEGRVRFCVSQILDRLGVADRTQAVLKAIKSGLVHLD